MNWSVKIWAEKRLTPLLASPSERNDVWGYCYPFGVEFVWHYKISPPPRGGTMNWSVKIWTEKRLTPLLASPSGRNDDLEYWGIWIICQLSKDGTNIPSPRERGRGEGYSELSLWVDEQNQIWNKLDLFGILRSAQNDGFKLKFLRMMRVIKNRPLS